MNIIDQGRESRNGDKRLKGKQQCRTICYDSSQWATGGRSQERRGRKEVWKYRNYQNF